MEISFCRGSTAIRCVPGSGSFRAALWIRGETPEKAAVRELKEETGYSVKKLHSLGAFYPSFGSTNEKIWLFAAECGEAGDSAREPGEVIRLTEMSEGAFRKLVAEGEFMHCAGLAAWARYVSNLD